METNQAPRGPKFNGSSWKVAALWSLPILLLIGAIVVMIAQHNGNNRRIDLEKSEPAAASQEAEDPSSEQTTDSAESEDSLIPSTAANPPTEEAPLATTNAPTIPQATEKETDPPAMTTEGAFAAESASAKNQNHEVPAPLPPQLSEESAEKETKRLPPLSQAPAVQIPRQLHRGKETLWNSPLIETEKSLWILTSARDKLNPAQWRTILVKNQRKLDITLTPSEPKMWQIIQEGSIVRLSSPGSIESKKSPWSKKKEKFAVQILSVEDKQLQIGLELTQRLLNEGYYAYIYRSQNKYEGKYWYRVRVGFFNSAEEAQGMGKEIYYRYRDQKLFPENYWAVLPAEMEVSRDLIKMNRLEQKPWMLEMPVYGSRYEALAEVPILLDRSEFFYLAQRRDPSSGQIQYRLRLGFFETAEAAQKLGTELSQQDSRFTEAKAVRAP